MFLGHNFRKLINNNWVIDLTEFYGYKVSSSEINNKKVIRYTRVFKVSIVDGEVTFEKYARVPLKVLKEAKVVVTELLEKM